MLSFLIFFLITIASNAVAQVPSNAPPCVSVCVNAKIQEASTLAPACANNDFNCMCGTATFSSAYSTCLSDNCPGADVQTGMSIFQQLCSAASAGGASSESALSSFLPSGSAVSSPSTGPSAIGNMTMTSSMESGSSNAPGSSMESGSSMSNGSTLSHESSAASTSASESHVLSSAHSGSSHASTTTSGVEVGSSTITFLDSRSSLETTVVPTSGVSSTTLEVVHNGSTIESAVAEQESAAPSPAKKSGAIQNRAASPVLLVIFALINVCF